MSDKYDCDKQIQDLDRWLEEASLRATAQEGKAKQQEHEEETERFKAQAGRKLA